mmetsp:Transcript_78081/g.135431  ORF Transcript_78081/g.135431 Transcript_78081/m.135431 type:complete len:194 (+) Transcript_78081:63-644(+)
MVWVPDHIWEKQKKKGGKGGKGGKSGGKGSKSGGAWMFIPAMSFGGGGGWKSGPKKTFTKKKEKKVPFSELSEEKKAEIREKHEARAEEEGRTAVNQMMHEGVLVKRSKRYGWIKPSKPAKLPKSVQEKMKAMVAEKKEAALKYDHEDTFDSDLIYVRMCDVEEGVKIETDGAVKFKVYTDEKGVGAFDVTAA